MRKHLVVLIIALLFFFTGFSMLLYENTSSSLNADEVKSRLENPQQLTILDVRSEEAYKKGHLYRSVHTPLASVNKTIKSLVPEKTAQIIIFAKNDVEALQAYKTVKNLGYTNAHFLTGGETAWKRSAYLLEK